MAKHRVGGSAAQQLHVVDALPAGDHGVDDGEQLAPRVGRARLVLHVDELVGGLFDPQPLGQGGGQQQASMRHGPLIIEGDVDLASTTCEDRIERASSDLGTMTAWQPSSSLVRDPFLGSHHYVRQPDR